MKYRRYQLTKEATAIVYRDQPWIFRDHLSSAASVFRDGDQLRLVDGTNKVIAYGIYDADGAIAIRIVRRGAEAPNAAWLRSMLSASLAKRAPLTGRTNGIRLLNGESDGLPGVVIDRFGDTLVAQSYTRGADPLARFSAIAFANELRIPNVVLRPAHRRKGEEPPARVLRGAIAETTQFAEDGITFTVDLATGQKSGTYLDLRGLRRAIATGFAKVTELPPPVPEATTTPKADAKKSEKAAKARIGPDGAATTRRPGPAAVAPRARLETPVSLAGAHVLNLFAYTGMIGRVAEQAGAAHITHVDSSATALAAASTHHMVDAAKHHHVTADIFQWLPALAVSVLFDLVIVDPPSMTSSKQQIPAVLAGYKKLYRAVAPHVKPGGLLVAACCTSRVERAQFHETVATTLGAGFERVLDLAPEVDHPAAFAQADYLKIEIWRRR